jgi:hypothetical protein
VDGLSTNRKLAEREPPPLTSLRKPPPDYLRKIVPSHIEQRVREAANADWLEVAKLSSTAKSCVCSSKF